MGLQKFEGRLERMVDGTLSKAFRGELHPVEIGRRLTREMDLQRRLGVHGLIAPNAFVVYLSTNDFDRFESFLDALVRELEEAAREHARTEDYVFVGPVTVIGHGGHPSAPGSVHRSSPRSKKGPSGLPAASIVLADGERVVLGPEPITIGRLPESAVMVTDPNASRRHAEIRRVGNDVRRGGPQLDQRHPGQRGHRARAEAGRRGRDRDRNHRPPVRDLVTAGA